MKITSTPGVGKKAAEEEYLTRYPGDEYVDILAFDYYDDYNTYPATSDGSFFQNLDKTCAVVASLANQKGKVAAISETGTRVMKADSSDNEGLLVKGNPISQKATGLNWYQEVSNIAKKNNMPYYLVWANFGDTNFYVPYRHDENYGHEMANEFIDFYNDNSSVFVKGTEAQYVTIPFSSFAGKKGGSLDTKNITQFAVWCNSIIPEGHSGEWKVSSTIYFDQIEATTIYENDLKNVKYTIEKKHKY